MRALPSLSFEYLGETAVGKTALPVAAVAAAVGAVAGVEAAGAASFLSALGAAVVAAAGFAAASSEHSALRKSFHFIPLRVPAVCAALYLALHSCIEIACAGASDAGNEIVTRASVSAAERIVMGPSP